MSTLIEIARQAGVSYSTVSRAFHGSSSISPETRKKILKIAERLNYFPNKSAKMLADRERSGSTPSLIGVVYGAGIALNDYYFSTVIQTIVDQAALAGYSTSISPVEEGYDRAIGLTRRLREHRLLGLILIGDIDEKLITVIRGYCQNSVIVDKPSHDLTSVYNDNERGAFEAVTYLLRCGCRRVALIHGPPRNYFTHAIHKGYRRALTAAGVPHEDSLQIQAGLGVHGGYEAMQKLLARGAPIDGVFSNDEMSIGALRALRATGYRVPEQVMLFGFDNLAISELVEPPLSTVKVNYQYMARTAVRKVIENGLGKKIVPVEIIIPVELVIRESTRCSP